MATTKHRIGKDLLVRWAFHNPEGGAFDLTGLDLRVFLLDYFQRRVEVTDYVLESDNVLVFTFAGTSQKVTGPYTLQAWVNKDKVGQSVVDACNCFELVSCTHMESDMGAEGPGTDYTDLVSTIQVGVEGKSAYASWISAGYKGTEEDFVAWLQEPARTAAATALETNRRVTEAEGLRVEEEKKRVAAEQLRVSAEDGREKVEQLRQQNEQQRSEAETARETAETLRANEEKKRVTAETLRAEEFARLGGEMSTATDSAKEATRLASEATAAARKAAEDADSTVRLAVQKTEEAALNANTAALEAGRAASAAATATTEAGKAAAAASTAATSATTEAGKATAAADKAEKAAGAANTAAGTIDTKIGDIRDTIEDMKAEGNALASDVSAGKKLMADAITKKGVPTKETDSYAVMADNVGKIYKGAYDEFLELVIDNPFPTDEVKRIGSSYIPDWMESNVEGAVFKDGKINYRLDRNNYLRKSNGMPSVIDGSDGDMLSKRPAFWYSYLVDSYNKVHMKISNIPQTSEGWYCSPEVWVSPHGMVFEQRDGKNYARSCYNTSPEFRGGDNNAKFDNLPGSRLGMQRTAVSHETMRTACKNKGSFDTGDYHGYCPALYIKENIMFMCIYGTRNWQADWSGVDPTTGKDKRNADGFKYGGLGRGVVDCASWWSKYNSSNPFIPTNACLEYGCRSGIYDYNLNIGTPEEPNVVTLKIPNFLGHFNRYGHTFIAIDGCTKTCYDKEGVVMEKYGLYFNPKSFVSAGTDGADVVIDRPATKTGYVKEVDQYMLPTAVGASESKHYCDYFWMGDSGNFSVWTGGYASYGGLCGGWCVHSSDGVGHAYSNCGGRLCFTPS